MGEMWVVDPSRIYPHLTHIQCRQVPQYRSRRFEISICAAKARQPAPSNRHLSSGMTSTTSTTAPPPRALQAPAPHSAIISKSPNPALSHAMVTQKDMAIGVLRCRRARLRRTVRAHFVLDHDLVDMHHAARVYLQVGALIRRSVSRAGRVGKVTFNVNVFSAQESLSSFRFLPSDVGRLAAALHLDAVFPLRRYQVEATECLAILLRRLASPARWADREVTFGRCRSSLSEIFSHGGPLDDQVGPPFEKVARRVYG